MADGGGEDGRPFSQRRWLTVEEKTGEFSAGADGWWMTKEIIGTEANIWPSLSGGFVCQRWWFGSRQRMMMTFLIRWMKTNSSSSRGFGFWNGMAAEEEALGERWIMQRQSHGIPCPDHGVADGVGGGGGNCGAGDLTSFSIPYSRDSCHLLKHRHYG